MLSVWIFTFFICNISASDYYVATYGDDDNPGTFESPFRNIQRASDVMTSGDVCYLTVGAATKIPAYGTFVWSDKFVLTQTDSLYAECQSGGGNNFDIWVSYIDQTFA